MKESRVNGAIVSVNLAVLLFGLAGLFAKWIHVAAIGITFGRVLFSSAVLLIYQRARGQSLRLRSGRDAALLAAAGAILALHWWSFLEAIQISTVAIGTITFSSYPLFVTFLEPVAFHQRLKARNIAAALMILAGVAITIPELSLGNSQFRGILVGMVSALSYAVLTVLNKGFAERYNGTQVAFCEQTVAAIALIPFVLRAGLRPSGTDVLLTAVLGVFMTALAHTLFISSLKGLSAQLAGICSSMETVYGILFAFLILREVPSAREIVGAAIILGVVAWTQLRSAKPEGTSA